MHVGLILPSYGVDEATRIPALAALAAGLARGADVAVFPLRAPAGPRRFSHDGVDVVAAGGPHLRFRVLARRTLAAIRDEHRRRAFDVLHGVWLYEPGLIAVLAGRLLGVPAVTSIAGAELAALPGIGYGGMLQRRARLIHRTVLRASTLVTGGSGYALDLALEQSDLGLSTLRLAPLPVDTAVFHSEQGTPTRTSGAGRLLQVGAYLPVKGQDLSIRALANVRAKVPGTTLTIIGEDPRGYRRRMADLAGSLGLDDAARLLERVPHGALGNHFRSADLLLMPSRHDIQPQVVIEAGALGLPAAGSDVGVVRDLAPSAAAAVPVDDVVALSNAITGLLGDDARRRGLGENARREVLARYAVAPAIERWLEVYAEAAERN